jgi:hypothetical protein
MSLVSKGRRPMAPNAVTKPSASLQILEDGAWVRTPKDDGFIQCLKEAVKWHSREWSPAETAWRVYGDQNIETVTGLVLTFWPDAEIVQGSSTNDSN